MTERIRELAEQAGFSFKYKTAPDEMNPGHKLKDLKKFAELIVRECALTLYKSAVKDKQAGFVHEANVMELAGDMIKQHFGVEE